MLELVYNADPGMGTPSNRRLSYLGIVNRPINRGGRDGESPFYYSGPRRRR